MNKYLKMIGFYLVILLIIIVAVTFLNPMKTEVKTLSYGEVLSNLDQKQIAEIEINQSTVKGKLKNGED
ncbi:MAG: ATP-dependent metallopeptidase FtsH/Yme1/Tma family protein, partial [Eubacterium sp.]